MQKDLIFLPFFFLSYCVMFLRHSILLCFNLSCDISLSYNSSFFLSVVLSMMSSDFLFFVFLFIELLIVSSSDCLFNVDLSFTLFLVFSDCFFSVVSSSFF